MLQRNYLLSCLLLVITAFAGGACAKTPVTTEAATAPETGYRIEVELEGFGESQVFLANYFMDKQYIIDTVDVVKGKAVFTGEEPLKQGMYLLVLPPDNDYAQLLIDDDQHFKLKARADDLTNSMQVSGSDENKRFFNYLQLLDRLRPEADSLRVVARDSSLSAKAREAAQAKVDAIDKQVKDEQARIKREHGQSILASLLRSFEETEMPKFTGTPDEVQRQQYLFYKDHYFDHVDLGDPRALRSTYLDQRVSYYLDKLVVPSPDSISKEIDYILEKMAPAPETFRAYVSKFLNEYATSKVVGQDAIYAHLAEKYYMSGRTPWVDSTTLTKIADNVLRLKPLLIGQPAPPLTTTAASGTPVNLYDIDADYTVLFFYDPECGVCKKQTPELIKFAKDFADRGVKVMTVCTVLGMDGAKCFLYVNEKEGMMETLINTYDPFHTSRFKIRYDINSTPQIFVFDKDKKIISKRIAAEQLSEVVGKFIEMRAAAAAETGEAPGQ